jgi:immune inhibitor A
VIIIKRAGWLILVLILAACNTEKKEASFPTLANYDSDLATLSAQLTASPSPPPPAAADDVARPPAQDGHATLTTMQDTLVPPRDRLDLARRLLGVTDIPAPPTVAPPELAIGTVMTFWADNLSQDRSFQVDAELVYKTEHVYMFVRVGQAVDPAAIKSSADQFENVILPKVHEVFGTEWTPGIDGDPHLYILHTGGLGEWAAAYYSSTSEYPVEAVKHSNEHEMFFVNLDTMAFFIGTPYYEGTLAHEFQHMVHWNVDANEDSWINEGLSELSTMITGYGADTSPLSFLNQPDIQLNTWPEDARQSVSHYGAAFLFMAYFYQRYGEAATTTLVRDPENGMEGVDTTLKAVGATDPTSGQPVTADDLFADWLVTNLVQDPALGDGRYSYTFSELADLFNATITRDLKIDGKPVNLEAPQWGANYLEIAGGSQPQRVRVTFKGAPTVSVVPTEAHSGQVMWWSNRADESDTRLTRTFDLTGVTQATLTYWTWYSIENLWDYGYVMVSTDDGATWTPLATRRTTDDDPHANAYGPGYTGQSNGWAQEAVDLTPYAGRVIQVCFEYITDDAVTQPGFIVDDVSIPEIGYHDDFENGSSDWTSAGWLLMDNVLPQDFTVQLVQVSNTTAPVTHWLSRGDDPRGEWEITVGGAYGDAVIVVSGLAPVTTEPAKYTVIVAPAP